MKDNRRKPAIFINYRRTDLDAAADRIHEYLNAQFGEDTVFLDKANISGGEPWPDRIRRALTEAEVVLALIGPRWFEEKNQYGYPRISLCDDWVRMEIEEAFRLGKTVVPIVFPPVQNFADPGAYPEGSALIRLKNLQAIEIRQTYFNYDIRILLDRLSEILGRPLSDQPAASLPAEYDPLKDLPLPASLRRQAPPDESPYVGLRPFERDHAPLFFGRGAVILDLYTQIHRPDFRVTLFYGQSGVGKSSLLFAGLFPRLEEQWTVRYHRRDKQRGLVRGLEQELQKVKDSAQPILIMLDQLEEMFTANEPIEDEASGLFRRIERALAENSQLHILLGFRSDYYVPVRDLVKNSQLPLPNEYLLRPLDRPGVLEAITGVVRSPLNASFKLSFEEGLPKAIADDILADKENHIGPVLQIQLRKLWEAAVKQQRRAGYEPVIIGEDLYRELRRKNLDTLLATQLEKLRETPWAGELENGLVLDLLYWYTTDRDTADSHPDAALLRRYRDADQIRALYLQLKELHLLNTELQSQEPATRLAHDALAPLVRQRYRDSTAPAQRAWRIVEDKHMDILDGQNVSFSQYDVDTIRAAEPFMPLIPAEVEECLQRSEQRLRLQAAELRDKTAFVFETLRKGAEAHILQVEHEAALEKLQAALEVNINVDHKRQRLAPLLSELLFFFAESGRHFPQAAQTAGLLSQWLPAENIRQGLEKCAAENWKERDRFRALLREMDAPAFEELRGRYYPVMKIVEGGEFKMGSDQGYGDEKPVHKVRVSGFQMAATPATFWQFGLYCAATDRKIKSFSPPWGRYGDNPAVMMMWYDVVSYANWLSEQLGFEPAYQVDKDAKDPNNNQANDIFKWLVTVREGADGFRLPTEAEWEYATRGGKHRSSFLYAGSDDLDEVGWYWQNSGEEVLTGDWDYEQIQNNNCRTRPVRGKKPNALGLYDLSGNVHEWCWDWFGEDYYQQSSKENPAGPEKGKSRVVRGGSWLSIDYYCRVSFRNLDSPSSRGSFVGCRLLQGLTL